MSSEPCESEVSSQSAPDLKVTRLKKTAGVRRRAKEAGDLRGELLKQVSSVDEGTLNRGV